jgi:hypothetical protein
MVDAFFRQDSDSSVKRMVLPQGGKIHLLEKR